MLGVRFRQRQTDAGVVDDTAATLGGGGQNAPLGGHHLHAGVDGGVRAQPPGPLVFCGVDPKRAAQPRGGQRSGLGHTGAGEVAGDLVGVGVQPFPEEGFHLVLAHLRPVGHRPQLPDQRIGPIAACRLAKGGQAAAHPPPRCFASGAVVIGQAGSAAVGGVAAATWRIRYRYPSPAVNLCRPIIATSPVADVVSGPAVMRRPLPFRDLNARGVW